MNYEREVFVESLYEMERWELDEVAYDYDVDYTDDYSNEELIEAIIEAYDLMYGNI